MPQMIGIPSGGFRLPTSNPAGNNQMGSVPSQPGLGIGGAKPVFQPSQPGIQTGSPNPLVSGLPPAHPAATPMLPGATAAASGSGAGSATYDPTSHYSGGQTDINKQLIDILGKGVGGSLDYILNNMSGVDSAIFKQWLAGMQPVEASERAQLQGTLGQMGVSGNSSVSAIANSNLEANFNAQAASENANLMEQNLQNTIGILTGLEPAASKEVATSGWSTFADVMNNITGDIGNLSGGSYKTSAGQALPFNSSNPSGDPMNQGAFSQAQVVNPPLSPGSDTIPYESVAEELFM